MKPTKLTYTMKRWTFSETRTGHSESNTSKPETYAVYLNNTKPMRYDFLDMVWGYALSAYHSFRGAYSQGVERVEKRARQNFKL